MGTLVRVYHDIRVIGVFLYTDHRSPAGETDTHFSTTPS